MKFESFWLSTAPEFKAGATGNLPARADGLPVIAAQERIRIDIFLKDNMP